MSNEALFAAVDLGSNSFRVELGRVVGDRIITQSYWKETIRLAAGFDQDGSLTPDTIERAIACLKRFKDRIGGLPSSRVRAVGTQAFRTAKNADFFLDKAQKALGYPIDILSGHEEARLVFKGSVNTLPPSSAKRLIVDIGGASTEFVIGQHLEPSCYESFHVGCVNTSIRFFKDGELSEERFNKAVIACAAEFEEVATQFDQSHFEEAYGSAGTFGAVAELCRHLWNEDFVSLHRLKSIKKQLLKYRNVNDINFPGLKADRKEVIAGGLAVLMAVFMTLGIDKMRVAPGALRAGLLYDLLGRTSNLDSRDTSVARLCQSTQISEQQSQLVTALTDTLSERLAILSQEDRKLLHWAARLHEVGMLISTSRYHRHGYYIVINADMPGFSSTEQSTMAHWILGQRGGLQKLNGFLDNENHRRALLALRLAVILAHSRQPIVFPNMDIVQEKKLTRISLDASWLSAHPLTAYLLAEEVNYWLSTPYRLVIEER